MNTAPVARSYLFVPGDRPVWLKAARIAAAPAADRRLRG